MKRFVTALALTLAAAPALALDLAGMSDAERQDFRNEVRAYLLENPEVLMEAIAVLEARQQQGQAKTDATLIQVNASDLFDDGFSYVGGNPDGDITMVEFLDYRCGFCKKAHPEVTQLLNEDGKIRYIIKELPILGDQSVMAARFAMSTLHVAGPEAYAKVHDNLMTFRGDISAESLRRLAESLEVDADAIFKGMASEQIDQELAANLDLARRMKINGTPSFVLGEQMMRGYVPLEAMHEIVAKERMN